LLTTNLLDDDVKRYCEGVRQRINYRSLFLSPAHSVTTQIVIPSLSSATEAIMREGQASELEGPNMDQQRRRLLQMGVASIEEAIFPQRGKTGIFAISPAATSRFLTSIHGDLARLQDDLYAIWDHYITSTAHNHISDIWIAIQELEEFEKQMRGDLQRQVLELLFGYYLIASAIFRDLRKYKMALFCADQGVKIAVSMNNASMYASALSERGYSNARLGMYGTINALGRFELNTAKIRDSVADTQEALKFGSPVVKALVALELSRTMGLLQQSEKERMAAISIGDQAGQWIDQEDAGDIYSQMLLKHSRVNQGRMYLEQAIAYNVIGDSDTAMSKLEDLARLQMEKGIPKNQARRNVWTTIVQAEVHMGRKEFDQAAVLATDALQRCNGIKSVSNISIITDIYSRLLQGSAYNHPTTIELGNALKLISIPQA
jgi:hypothetical protein